MKKSKGTYKGTKYPFLLTCSLFSLFILVRNCHNAFGSGSVPLNPKPKYPDL